MSFGKTASLSAFCSVHVIVLLLALAPAFASSVKVGRGGTAHASLRRPAPSASNFSLTAREENYSTYQMPGDGDLWPSCWAEDDNLYTANGDGTAFDRSQGRQDMAVSRIGGMPPELFGESLATDVGTNWSGPGFNRKPTGMLCTHGTLYLAFQNLDSVGFNSAPAGSIAKSTDHGVTWTWDRSAPMFGGPGQAPLFTTVLFLDFGKDSRDAIDQYVYAYGLDNNWRSQQALYLARVPANRVQERAAWQFYSGARSDGAPNWSANIEVKQPVLLDTRRVRPEMPQIGCPATDSVIAQGGVVYDKPLKRYLFTSWSCSTHELYEARTPWGPWKLVMSNDFTRLQATYSRGQYGTSIPSKFISPDGKRLFLQSNVCCSGDSYTFSLRELRLSVSARRTGF